MCNNWNDRDGWSDEDNPDTIPSAMLPSDDDDDPDQKERPLMATPSRYNSFLKLMYRRALYEDFRSTSSSTCTRTDTVQVPVIKL